MASSEPQLSHLGSALNWLLARDVSSARLASLFGTSPENIRVIAFRARMIRGLPVPVDATRLDRRPDSKLAKQIGIRPALDDAAWTPSRNRKLDLLRDQLAESVARFSSRYDFHGGAHELRRMLPQIGYAGDARRIALAGLVHEHIAWFLVHCGRCVSAGTEAAVSRDLWRVAWHESGHRDCAEGFVRAALIGAQASLLSRRPEEAIKTLDLARDAAVSVCAAIGSDHLRQRGVALLQLRQDEPAADCFRKSAELMETLNEAKTPAQVLMTGQRYLGLLGHPNCDQADDVFSAARSAFGEISLENSMALHWAAASCLCSDSPTLIRRAIEQLDSQPTPNPQFGHQLTIRRLLLITPELGFDDRLRRAWVRSALYENAVQSH